MINVTISRGSAGAQLLEQPAFSAQWSELCERCAWSTSYQSPAFVGTWYRIYSGVFEPVIVIAQTAASALRGILCLAVSREDGRLVAAGEVQSEYQCWVSDAEAGNEFALQAVLAVRREFPEQVLEFRHLPPSVPLEWLTDPRLRSRSVLTKKPRPLLRFAQMGSDSLNKTNNKKRFKGLKKLGEMEFRRLTRASELEAVFHDFATCYDLRLGAMHAHEPFAQDPLKKAFHLELMKEPGLLHASILTVGDLLASMHVNVCDRKQLHLNLIAYNPLLGKHSPGKFHIHLLSQMLIAEGYKELDLTPGGDPYKERFANAHDTAFVLSLHPTATSQLKTFIESRGDAWARRALGALQIFPARARDTLQSLRDSRIKDVWPRIRDQISSRRQIMIYVRPITREMDRQETPGDFRRDAIEDLLAYRPIPGGLSRKRFLLDALNRLEEGQHLYSCVRHNQLLYAGWVMERPSEVFVSRILPGFKLPAADALITGLNACGPAPESQLGSACLRAMFADLSGTKGIERTAMGVASGQNQIPLLEEAGFSWETSLLTATIVGRVRRSSRQVSPPAPREPEVIRSTVDH